jgi:peptidoglycan/LPS O-acetylase OafA/YrhL
MIYKQRNALNVIRIIAAMMVFMLHCAAFETDLGLLLTKYKLSFLVFPSAWGGVWIFFIVGGYLAGLGFMQGRYELTISGIKRYYIRRIQKTVVPSIIYILLCVALVYPEFICNLPIVLFRLVFFSYYGAPGVDGIGATWYVSQLLFFYFISPLLACICLKLKEKENNVGIIIIIAFLAVLGLLYRHYGVKTGLDWKSRIYTPWYGNIDLFLSGFFLAFVKRNNNKHLQPISDVVIAVLIVVNSYFNRLTNLGDPNAAVVCMYYFQSLYLLAVLFFLYSHSDDSPVVNEKEDYGVKGKVVVFVEYAAGFVFEFYLFHSLVLHIWAAYIQKFIDTTSIVGHLEYQLLVAFITAFLSILYKEARTGYGLLPR